MNHTHCCTFFSIVLVYTVQQLTENNCSIPDIDECLENATRCGNGICENTPGHYECSCHPGDYITNGGVCVPFNQKVAFPALLVGEFFSSTRTTINNAIHGHQSGKFAPYCKPESQHDRPVYVQGKKNAVFGEISDCTVKIQVNKQFPFLSIGY